MTKEPSTKRVIIGIFAGILSVGMLFLVTNLFHPLLPASFQPDIGHVDRDQICSLLGPTCAFVKDLYWDVLGTGKSLLFLIPAIGVAVIVFMVESKSQNEPLTLAKIFRLCFPKDVLLHRSAKVDYGYYISQMFVAPFIPLFSMLIPSTLIAAYLVEAFGTKNGVDASTATWIDRALFTLLMVMAIDLGYFFFHSLSHKIPLLWEFHKVHHSAQVLTPITALRVHPVDRIMEDFFVGILIGVLKGVYAIVYTEQITIYTVLNLSAVLFVYLLTSHLRHSHVWLSYGWALSHVLSSPAQHQIHHSKLPQHLDKNFGRVFSLWDWIAGSLYVPRHKEVFPMGLTGLEEEEYQGVLRLYFLPFLKAARMLSPQRPKPGTPA